MRLRSGEPTDLEAVARFHSESWSRTYRGIFPDAYLDGPVFDRHSRLWTERLGSPAANQLLLLATEDDALLGFICAFGGDDERWGTLVDNLHVRPDQQGRGLGRRLLGEAAAWSRDHYPGAGLHLWVFEANAPARRFYERLGAHHEESVTLDTRGGPAPACRYVWPSLDPLLAHAGEPR